MKVKSESEVTQSCPPLSDPMDCSLPGSSAHGIFQARVLEWVAIAFSMLLLIIDSEENQYYVIVCIWNVYFGLTLLRLYINILNVLC